jgi:hypothetical protein
MTTPDVVIEIEGQANPESDTFFFWSNRRSRSQENLPYPALHNMVRHGTLNVPAIGIATSGWTIDQLRERARDSINKGHHTGTGRSACPRHGGRGSKRGFSPRSTYGRAI